MVLTYTVELKTSKTFTSRKDVQSEQEASVAVKKMKGENVKCGHKKYSSFKLYDQLNHAGKPPVILKTWSE